jgi:hypothetical protein
LLGITIFDEVHESVFKVRPSDSLLQTAGGSVSEEPPSPKNHHMGADLFHNFEDMRAIKDSLPPLT